MYYNKLIRLFVTAAAVVSVVWATEASADVRIRQLFQTDGIEIMGQVMPATRDTNTIWLTKHNARLDAGDTASMILLGSSGKILQLDHVNRQYSQIDPNALGEAADPQIQQMLAGMKLQVEVTPTDDKQKIGEYNCRKYIIEKQMGMMKSTTIVWATTDVEVNTEAYHKILNALMAYMSDYENTLKQFSKIEGMTVKEETTAEVMGQKVRSSSELIEFHKEDAPKDAFTIPDGYKEVPMPLPGSH